MITKAREYAEIVNKSFAISKDLLLENSFKQISEEKDNLLKLLSDESIIKVPIVGDFSAGKSSMVNCLLGRNGLLPVDITPETAVAYELYYGSTEKVELYRDGKKIEEQAIQSIKQLAVKPGDIAKVYVDSPTIRNLQEKGIIIVDMPGIDSGIKEHNDAILHYINKGTAFILLTDAETGSLRESTISFITELSKYNLKPAVLVSKTDKKPESEISSIKEYIEFQAKRAIGEETFVGCISSANNNITDFTQYLSTLDSNVLIAAKFAMRVISFINLQIINITTQKDILNANLQDVDEKIKKLEAEKQRISEQLSDSVPFADTPEKSTQDILDLVKMELDTHAEDIATKVVNKEDANTINAMLMNYIRPVVINAFKEEGEQYAAAMNTAVDDVSRALQDTLHLEGNFVDGIVEEMREEIIGAVQMAAEALKFMGAWGKVLGWILTFFGDKIPDIIRWFFGKSKESIIDEATEKIRTSVIDKITEQLRPIMYEQVKAQQERIRESVKKKVADAISSIQDSIESAQKQDNSSDINARIAAMDIAINQLLNIKQTIN